MVRVINPYAPERPIGAMLSQIGQQLFGDQAGAALNREQAYAAQRSNAETDNLMRWAATGQNLNTLSPEAAAMLIGSGYDPNDLGRIGSLYASTNLGARADETTNWQAGLGEYGNTAQAFDLDLAEVARNNNLQSSDRRYGVDVGAATTLTANDADNAAALARQNALPYSFVGPDGLPLIGTQGTAVGQRPILSNTEVQGTLAQNAITGDGIDALPAAEQDYLGVGGTNAPTPRNYQTPDGRLGTTHDGGRTDAISGEPLPQGTVTFAGQLNATDAAGLPNSVKAQQFEALYESEDTLALGNTLLEAANAAAPEQFGAAGSLTNFVRGAVNGIANLAGLAGLPLNSETLYGWAQQNSPNLSQPLLRALFAPNANETQSLAALYVYLAAGALTGQRSRDLSDNDIQIIMPAIGDPMAWGTTQATFVEGINRAQGLIQQRMDANRRRLEGGGEAVPTGTPAPDADGWATLPDGTRYRQVSP